MTMRSPSSGRAARSRVARGPKIDVARQLIAPDRPTPAAARRQSTGAVRVSAARCPPLPRDRVPPRVVYGVRLPRAALGSPRAALGSPRAALRQSCGFWIRASAREFPLARSRPPQASAGMDLRACIDAPLILSPGAAVLVQTGIFDYIADPRSRRGAAATFPASVTSTASCSAIWSD